MRLQDKQSQTNKVPLQTGDRVLVKATQYTSRTGKQKFLCDSNGAINQYIVTDIMQGMVHLQQIGTGKKSVHHEANIKQMPRNMEAQAED